VGHPRWACEALADGVICTELKLYRSAGETPEMLKGRSLRKASVLRVLRELVDAGYTVEQLWVLAPQFVDAPLPWHEEPEPSRRARRRCRPQPRSACRRGRRRSVAYRRRRESLRAGDLA